MWWTGRSIFEGFMGVIDSTYGLWVMESYRRSGLDPGGIEQINSWFSIEVVLPVLVIIWGTYGNQLMAPFGAQFLSSSVGTDLGACADMLTFRARWELGERGQRVYVFIFGRRGWVGSISCPECTLNYTDAWFITCDMSSFSQSTLKAARNRNNVYCDSSTYRIPYGTVVKKMYFGARQTWVWIPVLPPNLRDLGANFLIFMNSSIWW